MRSKCQRKYWHKYVYCDTQCF